MCIVQKEQSDHNYIDDTRSIKKILTRSAKENNRELSQNVQCILNEQYPKYYTTSTTMPICKCVTRNQNTYYCIPNSQQQQNRSILEKSN